MKSQRFWITVYIKHEKYGGGPINIHLAAESKEQAEKMARDHINDRIEKQYKKGFEISRIEFY